MCIQNFLNISSSRHPCYWIPRFPPDCGVNTPWGSIFVEVKSSAIAHATQSSLSKSNGIAFFVGDADALIRRPIIPRRAAPYITNASPYGDFSGLEKALGSLILILRTNLAVTSLQRRYKWLNLNVRIDFEDSRIFGFVDGYDFSS